MLQQVCCDVTHWSREKGVGQELKLRCIGGLIRVTVATAAPGMKDCIDLVWDSSAQIPLACATKAGRLKVGLWRML